MTPKARIACATAIALSALLFVAENGVAGAPSPTLAQYIEPKPAADQGRFIRVAGLFGESDEEKAARLQHEADQDGQIGRLTDRVRDLEDTVRSLRGQNEDLGHQVNELNAKIDKMGKDFEYRLCTMAAQQLGAGAGQGDPNALPCAGGGYSSSNTYVPPPSSNNVDADEGASAPVASHLAPPPGVLGTLSPGEDTGRPPPRNTAATGSNDDARNQFSNAMNLLAKARYDEASAAFRAFADAHPNDELAPQAVYWVADIAYVQKDYAGAARGFAEVIKKYPTSTRAPDSMLKLGQSLIAGGQKKEGCTALAALPAKYPKASKNVLAQGADARKASCRAIS
ncbi:MAG: tol-pal system protein YbgF [Alphaproteobacteria bacterium]|nr:tol-pal system protein YbgF [Alphaproteobacteria bacterium]